MSKPTPKPGARVRGSSTGRPIMAALDLLGRRGALRILWELREGDALTFRELAERAELSPATLNTRLAELREAAIVAQDAGYTLTASGQALVEAFAPLQAWAQDWQRALARRAR
ncbi:MAG: helix-turn-helix domain-containing protein [Polyangiales bacterium]